MKSEKTEVCVQWHVFIISFRSSTPSDSSSSHFSIQDSSHSTAHGCVCTCVHVFAPSLRPPDGGNTAAECSLFLSQLLASAF